MHADALRPLRPLPLVLLLAGCGPGGSPGGGAGAVRPGDLVFTEILANPAGPDAGGEWLELANVSGLPLELEGLVLLSGARGEGPERSVVLPAHPVAPDDRVVLAASPGPGVDLVWDAALGALRNEDGRVALQADGALVDEATWATAAEGRPRALDGARVPDAVVNDAGTAWCVSEEGGSPGRPNPPCPAEDDAGRCLDGGQLRPARAPGPGDLVITEVMADPAAAPDADGEWFEVRARADVDLNGLTLGREPGLPVDEVAREDCVALPSGAYAVFARRLDADANGGLARADLAFGFSLVNRGGRLALGHGGRTLDEARWDEAASGAASSRAPGDDAVRWCKATDLMANGDRGTPGAPNPDCPVPVPEGHCRDGDTVRPLRRPGWGDLRVNEVLADPAAVPDADGEWLELLALAEVDLNGVTVGAPDASAPTRLDGEACLTVTPGERLVLARNPAPGANGGLPRVFAGLSGALVNTPLRLVVSRRGGLVDWAEVPRGAPGVAASRDEVRDTWCPASAPYGAGDLGTPGAENPPCP